MLSKMYNPVLIRYKNVKNLVTADIYNQVSTHINVKTIETLNPKGIDNVIGQSIIW
jgi:hypothetical protein